MHLPEISIQHCDDRAVAVVRVTAHRDPTSAYAMESEWHSIHGSRISVQAAFLRLHSDQQLQYLLTSRCEKNLQSQIGMRVQGLRPESLFPSFVFARRYIGSTLWYNRSRTTNG